MFKVERIYLNGDTSDTATWDGFVAAVNAEGAKVITLRRGQNVPLGGLQLPVLHPPSLSGDSNIDSIVLRLTCGSVDVLFTGDAETPSETSMLGAGVVTDIEVLKVGHHGSNSSSSLPFLQTLQPEVAVISAGLNNQYGHPHADTLTRLASVGASPVYTDTTAGDDSVVMTSNCATYNFSVPVGGGPTPTPTRTPTPTQTSTGSTPTNTPTPTATVAAVCGGSSGDITALNKVGETVTVNAQGLMTGWYIISESGNQQFNFPNGYVGNGTVTIYSATPAFTNTQTTLWWSAANLLGLPRIDGHPG